MSNLFSSLCPNVPGAVRGWSPVLVVGILVLPLQVLNDVLQQAPILHLVTKKEEVLSGLKCFSSSSPTWPRADTARRGRARRASMVGPWKVLYLLLCFPSSIYSSHCSRHLSPWTASTAVKNRSIRGLHSPAEAKLQRRPSSLLTLTAAEAKYQRIFLSTRSGPELRNAISSTQSKSFKLNSTLWKVRKSRQI